MFIRVECETSFRGEEEPRRFFLGGSSVEVIDIPDRWLSANHQYYMVLDPQGDMYILRRNFMLEGWEMTMYDSGRTAEGKFEAISTDMGSFKESPRC